MWKCMNCGARDYCDFTPPECECGCENSWVKNEGRNSNAKIVRAVDCDGSNLKRVKAENDELNELLNGGWPLGFTVLIWGMPGGGKSRLTYRWASLLGPTLICPYEYGAAPRCYQLAKQTLESSGGKSENVHFTTDADWRRFADRVGAKFVVIDSLNWKSAFQDPVISTQEAAYWAARNNGFVWIISHATKAGDAKGLNELQHWPDATMIVRRTPQNTAKLSIVKSRFCGPGFTELSIITSDAETEDSEFDLEGIQPYAGIE